MDEALRRDGLTNENDPPIVAVNEHSGNPHYTPTAERSAPIRKGDFVLLDVWARKQAAGAVYYDITWTGFVGPAPSAHHQEIFTIVRDARDVGVKTAQEAVAARRHICGWEVDAAVRAFIERAGYGKYFVHRTGHSIGEAVLSPGIWRAQRGGCAGARWKG
jgi:Xaa-Pro aminopeptidase